MTETPTTGKNKLPLHWKMAIGFIAGLAMGLLVYMTGIGQLTAAGVGNPACVAGAADLPWQCTPWVQLLTSYVTGPIGQLFLNLIFMLVVPLLFSALVVGVSEMGDIRAFGRVGWRTLGYTVLMSSIAVVLGLLLVNWLQPGSGIDRDTAQHLLAEGAQRASAIVASTHEQPRGLDMLLSIVPDNVIKAAADNTILAVMFFALMLGIGMVLTPGKATDTLREGIQGLFDVSMTLIGLVIQLAPYAVFCFMFDLAAKFGWDLLFKLASYVGVVVLALHSTCSWSIRLRCARLAATRRARSSAAPRKRWCWRSPPPPATRPCRPRCGWPRRSWACRRASRASC